MGSDLLSYIARALLFNPYPTAIFIVLQLLLICLFLLLCPCLASFSFRLTYKDLKVLKTLNYGSEPSWERGK